MDLMEQMKGIVGAAAPEPQEHDAIKRANERATQAYRLMLRAEEEKTEVLRALRHVLENEEHNIDGEKMWALIHKYEGQQPLMR